MKVEIPVHLSSGLSSDRGSGEATPTGRFVTRLHSWSELSHWQLGKRCACVCVCVCVYECSFTKCYLVRERSCRLGLTCTVQLNRI